MKNRWDDSFAHFAVRFFACFFFYFLVTVTVCLKGGKELQLFFIFRGATLNDTFTIHGSYACPGIIHIIH